MNEYIQSQQISLIRGQKRDKCRLRTSPSSAIEENLWGESTDAAVRADIIDSLVRDNVGDVVRVSVTLYSPARGPP